MSINHSAKLVTDGLVMYYDMSNTKKSWKGAPTTNVLVDTGDLSTGNWGYTLFGNWPATGAVANVATAPDGTLTATRLSASGYSRFQRYTVSANQVYTFSMWVRNVNMPGAISLQLATGLNGTLVSYGYATGVNLTANWAVYSYTITIPASGVNQLEVGLNVSANSYNSNIFCDVWHPQLEAQSFATPFVNGTRSNAQVLVDLTGNNTLTASSLTYASDGTFSFNGSTSLISLPSLNLQSGFTLECWVNLTSSGTSVGFFGQGPTVQNQGLHIGWFPGRGLLFGLYSNDLECPSYNMTYNTWHHFVFTYNSSTYFRQTFADGVLVASGTLSVYSGSGQFNIGAIFSSPSTPFIGKYAIAKAYNRVLSAAEVAQNFQALRGRYSL